MAAGEGEFDFNFKMVYQFLLTICTKAAPQHNSTYELDTPKRIDLGYQRKEAEFCICKDI
jgi:hypothetical protein